jgi:drug/metabolite transporter (DMT)-like permease
MIAAIVTTFLFALTAVCATQSSKLLGSNMANFARLLVAFGLLGCWHIFWGTSLEGQPMYLFVAAGAIGFGFGGLCMFQAFPRLGATLSLLVVECSAAVSTTVIAWIWLDAAISLKQSIFTLLSISGVIIGLFPKTLPGVSSRQLLIGAAFAAIASCGQSASFLLSKKAFMVSKTMELNPPPLSAATYRLFGGLIVAFLVIASTKLLQKTKSPTNPIELKRADRPKAALWVTANALAGPVLGVTFMLWAIREVGNPGIVQSIVATATLISVPLSRITENQRLDWPYFIGACISIAGTTGLLIFS